MPVTYTHTSFGQAVLTALPDELQTIICSHPGLYQTGLYGPKLFLCYPSLISHSVYHQEYQRYIENTSAFFQNALSTLWNMSDPEAGLSYIFGFICHFTLEDTYPDSSQFHHLTAPCPLPQSVDCRIVACFFQLIEPKQIARALKVLRYYPHVTRAEASMPKRNTSTHDQKPQKNPALQNQRTEAFHTACQLIENFYNAYLELDILSDRFARPFPEYTNTWIPCKAVPMTKTVSSKA